MSIFLKNRRSMYTSHETSSQGSLWEQHASSWHHEAIAKAYLSSRECSVQEAVYHILSELKLRRIFPAVYFVNKILPEERVQVLLSEKEHSELLGDSPNIFKKSNINGSLERPNGTFYHAEYKRFLLYRFESKSTKTCEYQPNELDDNHKECSYWKNIYIYFFQMDCFFQRWCVSWSNFWHLESSHISLRFLVSEIGLTTLVAQVIFILRGKLWKVVMKYQKSFFIFFGPFFSKYTYLKLEHFLLPSTYPINSIFFRGIVCFLEVMFLVKQFLAFAPTISRCFCHQCCFSEISGFLN